MYSGRADAGCVDTSLHRLCVGSHWNVGEILGLWRSKELNDWYYVIVLVLVSLVGDSTSNICRSVCVRHERFDVANTTCHRLKTSQSRTNR